MFDVLGVQHAKHRGKEHGRQAGDANCQVGKAF